MILLPLHFQVKHPSQGGELTPAKNVGVVNVCEFAIPTHDVWYTFWSICFHMSMTAATSYPILQASVIHNKRTFKYSNQTVFSWQQKYFQMQQSDSFQLATKLLSRKAIKPFSVGMSRMRSPPHSPLHWEHVTVIIPSNILQIPSLRHAFLVFYHF